MKTILMLLLISVVASAQDYTIDDSNSKARIAEAMKRLPKDKSASDGYVLDKYSCPSGQIIGQANIDGELKGATMYYCVTPDHVEVKCTLNKVDYYDDYTYGHNGSARIQKHSAPYDECHYVYAHVQEYKTYMGMLKYISSAGYNGPVSVWKHHSSLGKDGMIMSGMMKNGGWTDGSFKNYAKEVYEAETKAKTSGK